MNIQTPRITISRLKQFGLFLCFMTMAVAPSQAASVSFYLNESNRLPDDINYLSVNLTENMTGGVDVMARTLDPLNNLGTKHFGIQKFAFSFDDGTMGDVTGLPDGWQVKSDRRMIGFGKFDTGLLGRGDARTDTLNFTVNGVGIDDFEPFFAVKVTGLVDEFSHSSAFFAGSLENGFSSPESGNTSVNVAPVPVPAAIWLLSSGLVGLMGLARRGKR
ncbi:MAG: VPLPA-CTERM sorting domain-containing protein [Sulfuricaulis sp.]